MHTEPINKYGPYAFMHFLIIHLITVVPLFLLIFFKFQTKFILRISGLPKYTIFRKFLWKIISKKIFSVTCPSEQTKNDLIKLKIFPKEKLKILYDPILNIKKISGQIKEKNKYNDKTYTYHDTNTMVKI